MEMETYETSDIALASYLLCSGAHLAKIDRQNPQRCIFVFNVPNQSLITKWQAGKATVNALAFHNAYQALKARLFRGDWMEPQTVKNKGSSKTDSQITVEWHDAETASPQFRKLMAMLLIKDKRRVSRDE